MSGDTEDKELIDIARMGIEAERFLSSPVGKYIVDRAELECEAAIKAMKTVDPSNVTEVRKLQDQLNIPDKVVAWIKEVISAGESAEFVLVQKDAEDSQY